MKVLSILVLNVIIRQYKMEIDVNVELIEFLS